MQVLIRNFYLESDGGCFTSCGDVLIGMMHTDPQGCQGMDDRSQQKAKQHKARNIQRHADCTIKMEQSVRLSRGVEGHFMGVRQENHGSTGHDQKNTHKGNQPALRALTDPHWHYLLFLKWLMRSFGKVRIHIPSIPPFAKNVNRLCEFAGFSTILHKCPQKIDNIFKKYILASRHKCSIM